VLLTIRHVFPCPPERFWEIFWHPEYDRRLDEAAGTRHEVLAEWREDGLRCWRSRYEASSEGREGAESVVALLGGGFLEFDQESRLDEERGRLVWEVRPRMDLGGAVSARGELQVDAVPEGCERRVQGEIRVRVPLVGGQVERAVGGAIESSYEREARVLESWLASPPDRP
jgi:hypothetical protein